MNKTLLRDECYPEFSQLLEILIKRYSFGQVVDAVLNAHALTHNNCPYKYPMEVDIRGVVRQYEPETAYNGEEE